MKFLKKYRGKIIFAAIAVILLVVSYFYGGGVPSEKEIEALDKEAVKSEILQPDENKQAAEPQKEEKPLPEEVREESEKAVSTEEKATPEKILQEENVRKEPSASENEINDSQTELKVEPREEAISDKVLTCTFSITCETLLNNKEWIDSEKKECIPPDGVIFEEKEVEFFEGESVFNLLMREMKKAKIHMEYTSTPIYNSAYIEGIGNIYEFGCGELSGWMYKVNDWFPNYGCSRYQLKEGDKVEWVYTCNLGKDVGGEYSARNGYVR